MTAPEEWLAAHPEAVEAAHDAYDAEMESGKAVVWPIGAAITSLLASRALVPAEAALTGTVEQRLDEPTYVDLRRGDQPFAKGWLWSEKPGGAVVPAEAVEVAEVLAADGWDDVSIDALTQSAVEAVAWQLLEQTTDTSDRHPSASQYEDATATARRVLSALATPAPDSEGGAQ